MVIDILKERVRRIKTEFNKHIKVIQADCLDWMKQQPDDCFDLIIGSPPYAEKGHRYKDHRQTLKSDGWIRWMLDITTEAVRISSGMVLSPFDHGRRPAWQGQPRYLSACRWLTRRKGGGRIERVFWRKVLLCIRKCRKLPPTHCLSAVDRT